MNEIINGYELTAPFGNENAGFSRWTHAVKNGRKYFIKEFLDPVYPKDTTISEGLRKRRIEYCKRYEAKKVRLYKAIGQASDGNLLRTLDFFRCETRYYIVTEMIQNDVDTERIGRFSENDRLLLCKTLAHAMRGLHRQHIVHSDLKENNILIRRSKGGRLVGKIIDFDCSFFEDDPPQQEDDLGGDQVYLAPEACRFLVGEEVTLTCKMDIFALGMLFHLYMTGELPAFDTESYDYAHEAVLDGQALLVSDQLGIKMQALLRSMLSEDPEDRVSIEEVYSVIDAMLPDPHPDMEKVYEMNPVLTGSDTLRDNDQDRDEPQVQSPGREIPDPPEINPVPTKRKDPRSFYKKAGDL